jgi:hypothetical protein
MQHHAHWQIHHNPAHTHAGEGFAAGCLPGSAVSLIITPPFNPSTGFGFAVSASLTVRWCHRLIGCCCQGLLSCEPCAAHAFLPHDLLETGVRSLLATPTRHAQASRCCTLASLLNAWWHVPYDLWKGQQSLVLHADHGCLYLSSHHILVLLYVRGCVVREAHGFPVWCAASWIYC